MIYDIFTFNGEYDLLEIRLNILNDYVDKFIIVEATTTFSGKDKPLYYEKEKARYKKWEDKIKYHIVRPEDEEKYMALANGSPNTEYGKGAKHWVKEFCQKECIKDALVGLNDNDICFIGDCDEIWDKSVLEIDYAQKLKLRVCTYYLNNRSSEEFYGGIICRYYIVKEECLNHLRTTTSKTDNYYGWHFTSLKDGLRRKLTDSYTEDSYATPSVISNLENNILNNRDFLGRSFTYKIDESDLPQYLLDNKQKYIHLWKQ